ncbi:DEAD/DEAH box helicase [Fructobacillus sp. M2-14]|uniref:DEAD/DEAH box helicase n=1 Tax=Fructobacillus broussonetiae TaxID=2713173 RepID=A0ABS5R0J2_9LACO|nr:DEAD/DEAH box helicase [Fructobacillus broussonetiae]MBS9338963.1 DEAD/DEAH box helicase [Fructobacillus broussonetiae]
MEGIKRERMNDGILYGRLLTWPKVWPVPKGVTVIEPFKNGRCFRCGQNEHSPLPNGHYFCLACLNLGRISTHDLLLTLPEPNVFESFPGMSWKGHLTTDQGEVGQALVNYYRKKKDQLVWAVTGAGKTEMLFLLINDALRNGDRVALLSPRVDVVLELAPRLKAAFPVFTQVLYGAQEAPYQYSQFVIGTTHQALRFYRAFDLIAVDEVDAFPFRNNPILERALKQAKKETGSTVYLSATPSKKLLRQERRGKLIVHELPARFHGHLLPEIQVFYEGSNWQLGPPKALAEAILRWEQAGLPFLLFVPHVDDLEGVFDYVQKLTKYSGTTVHARDKDRLSKVSRLRGHNYQYLITTTILERGVTLPGLQVAVLGADSPVFSASALVQIAGRVGRSQESAEGDVIFLAKSPTWAIFQAKRAIKKRNRLAQKRRTSKK